MAGIESGNTNEYITHGIPGFRGMEKLNTIPALKSGSFREFLNKVIGVKKNPVTEKQVYDEIKRTNDDNTLTANGKKSQLRRIDRAKLFAVIGKNIEFGETGLTITLDFGDLTFAEKQAIGAGDILPQSIKKVAFERKYNPKPTIATRTIGKHGREYRSKNNRYMISRTNTKLFIDYKDIAPLTGNQERRIEAIEKSSIQKSRDTRKTARTEAKALKTSMKLTPPVARPPATPQLEYRESNETVSRRPIIIGDSQAQGIGLSKEIRKNGIYAAGFVSRRIETIAKKIDNKKNADLRRNIGASDSIILQCGGNNIVHRDNLQKMQNALKMLIGSVRRLNQSAPIYVGLLMQPTNKPVNLVTRLTYNEWLKGEAKKGTFRIIDSYGAVADKNNPAQRDPRLVSSQSNPHLNGRGYSVLAKTMLGAINYRKT